MTNEQILKQLFNGNHLTDEEVNQAFDLLDKLKFLLTGRVKTYPIKNLELKDYITDEDSKHTDEFFSRHFDLIDDYKKDKENISYGEIAESYLDEVKEENERN